MKKIINFLLVFSSLIIFSQERKIANAYKFEKSPNIDGKFSTNEWSLVKPNSGFSVWVPETRAGFKIDPKYESTVYFGYDDYAIYVGAINKHPDPESMPKEFALRDKTEGIQSEAFWVSINTFDDKINFQSFEVTAAGTISDMFTSGDFDPQNDYNFDTVFEGKTSYDENAWYVEMRIPYSALRFPKKDIQEWGINFGRVIPEKSEYYIWNSVDPKLFNYQQGFGLLKGIKNIDPPTRLFFYPYLQVSQDYAKGISPQNSYSAGMDLKYGINNSFTLDATLIPDFGQVTFDDRELNLTPFEQEFDENRQFFTEGATLFEKADGDGYRAGKFFYTRRIGQEISFNENDYILNNEELINYDKKPNLINSVKLTGTTDKKLSIGFLNAITAKAHAYFRDKNTGNNRKVVISPTTNYNIISLSQQLINEYSSISFLNTSVTREGKNYDSNNQALIFDIYDNKKKYSIKSSLYQSYSPAKTDKKGFRGSFTISELLGNFRPSIGWVGTDSDYQQNDFGIYRLTDTQGFYLRLRYQIFKETKLFRSFSNYLWMSRRYTFEDFIKKGWGFRQGNNFTFQNLMSASIDFDYTSKTKDFNEPRVKNRFFIEPENFEIQLELKSNPRNKFTYGFEYSGTDFYNEQFNEQKNRKRFQIFSDFRASNKLSFGIGSQTINTKDDVGYIERNSEKIFFGRRDVKSFENNFELLYNLNTKSAVSLKARNFWSTANYDKVLFELLNDGNRKIVDYSNLKDDPNTNFNLWNFDLNFEWWFAPGSNLTFLYRNQIFNQDNFSYLDYNDSLSNLFDLPIQHQVSLRVNYFIDYNRLRKK